MARWLNKLDAKLASLLQKDETEENINSPQKEYLKTEKGDSKNESNDSERGQKITQLEQKTRISIPGTRETNQHDFIESSLCKAPSNDLSCFVVCSLCYDVWDECGSDPGYSTCQICQRSSHRACLDLVKTHISCDIRCGGMPPPPPTNANENGIFKISLLSVKFRTINIKNQFLTNTMNSDITEKVIQPSKSASWSMALKPNSSKNSFLGSILSNVKEKDNDGEFIITSHNVHISKLQLEHFANNEEPTLQLSIRRSGHPEWCDMVVNVPLMPVMSFPSIEMDRWFKSTIDQNNNGVDSAVDDENRVEINYLASENMVKLRLSFEPIADMVKIEEVREPAIIEGDEVFSAMIDEKKADSDTLENGDKDIPENKDAPEKADSDTPENGDKDIPENADKEIQIEKEVHEDEADNEANDNNANFYTDIETDSPTRAGEDAHQQLVTVSYSDTPDENTHHVSTLPLIETNDPRSEPATLVTPPSSPSSLSPMSPMSPEAEEAQKGPHLFRLTTLKKPTWCAVCDNMLVGIYHQGHVCETCGLAVHSNDCQVEAHDLIPCGKNRLNKNKTQHGKMYKVIRQAIKVVAPKISSVINGDKMLINEENLKEDMKDKAKSSQSSNSKRKDKSGGSKSVNIGDGTSSVELIEEGVGKVTIELLCAHKCNNSCHMGWPCSARDTLHLGYPTAFLSPKNRREIIIAKGGRTSDNISPKLQPTQWRQGDENSASLDDNVEASINTNGVKIPLNLHNTSTMDEMHGLNSELLSKLINHEYMSHDETFGTSSGDSASGTSAGAGGGNTTGKKETHKRSDLFVRCKVNKTINVGRTATKYRTDGDTAYFGSDDQGKFDGITIPHYKSTVALHLTNASSDRVIGSIEIPVSKLAQREGDAKVEGWSEELDHYVDLPLTLNDCSEPSIWPSHVVKGNAIYKSNQNITSVGISGYKEVMGPNESISSEVVGFIRCKIRFSEVKDLFELSPPRCCPQPPAEEFSIATFQRHISRANAVIAWFSDFYMKYVKIISWENPPKSFVILLIFVWCCVSLNAEYAPCLPAALLLFHLIKSHIYRTNGKFVHYWLYDNFSTAGLYSLKHVTTDESESKLSNKKKSDSKSMKDFTPLAMIKIAVIEGKDLGLRMKKAIQKDKVVHVNSSAGGAGVGIDNDKMDESIKSHTCSVVELRNDEVDDKSNPKIELFRSRPVRYYVKVSYIGDISTCWKGPSSHSTKLSNRELVIGQTSYSSTCSEPIWTSRSLPKEEDVFLNKKVASNTISNRVNSGDTGNRGGLFRPLINVLLPEEDNSGGGGSGDDYQSSRTVHAVTRPWLKFKDQPPDPAFYYHILQTRRQDRTDVSSDNAATTTASAGENEISSELIPWHECEGVIRFRVMEDTPLLDDTCVHTCDIPLRQLVDSETASGPQLEIDEWFELQFPSSREASFKEGQSNEDASSLHASLHVRLQLILRDESLSITEDEIEVSEAVKAALARSASTIHEVRNDKNDNETTKVNHTTSTLGSGGIDDRNTDTHAESILSSGEVSTHRQGTVNEQAMELLPTGRFEVDEDDDEGGGTISTILGMKETAGFVQNGLGDALEVVEKYKNLLNWSKPEATFPIFICAIVVWVVLVLIPSRYLLLAGGLFEFFKKFIFSQSVALPPQDIKRGSMFNNLIACVPSDEELRLSYAHESKYIASVTEDYQRSRRRRARLRGLCGCQWESPLIRISIHRMGRGGSMYNTSTTSSLTSSLKSISSVNSDNGFNDGWARGGFAVLQGKRLLWWATESSLETGRSADALMTLHGHAGVTAPSPADLKYGKASCMSCVFASEPTNGNGRSGSRQRWTMLFAEESENLDFIAAIESALAKDE